MGCSIFIGAARPSIADTFLPRKIDAGREGEIRERIGCNIRISSAVRCAAREALMSGCA
ncbi:MAG TPA: hypothetical protein VKQ31_03035 [Steroidobacteraceae bacterium]|nr:hypothetical protein [Steroidobacteraceae bacterium]